MIVIGIDPGSTGAFAFYDGAELEIYDMPVHEIKKGKSVRKRFDPYGAMRILLSSRVGVDVAYIEQVSAQPGNGAAQAFTYGWMCGGIEACLAAAEIPFTYVTPQKWKKAMACPREKDGARMRASHVLPAFADQWKLKKHDGRAEASLIAVYAHMVEGGA